MKSTHFRVGRAAACAVVAIPALAAPLAQAQTPSFPNRLVRFVVTYPAGGSSDIMARIIGAQLSESWGQQVLVDPRPGAAGAIGMEFAAKQPPDGYTLLLGNFGPITANPLLSKVNYDAQKDFAPVSMTTVGANILVVPTSLPVKNVKQLVALAKARPGELTFGTSGPGSMSHLAGEMFKRLANVNITQVAYKGGVQWITDTMGGHIAMVFADALPAMTNLKSGKLRALAVTSEKRSPFTPDVPSLTEEGITGFAAVNWWGILVPTGTPRPVIDRINADLVKVLAKPDVKTKLGELGVEAISSTPEGFGDFMEKERVKWTKLIREANIRIE